MTTGYQPWNRTPGKPSAISLQSNVPVGPANSWDISSPPNMDDMWSNNAVMNRKPWPDTVDNSNWNSNTLFGTASVAPSTDTMGVWGAPQLVSPTNSISGPTRSNSGQGRNIWPESNMAKDSLTSSGSMLENVRASGDGPQSSSATTPVTSNALNKRVERSGPSLTDLNAMLNTLNNNNASFTGNGTNPELDEIIKAIINVNDAWGQRNVDQSQPWDTSSLPVASDDGLTSSPTASTSASMPVAIINTGVPGQVNVFSSSQNRGRMKMGPSQGGSMESNVWSHEPPNGTGIWEAHYESLGERTAHWQQAAAASSNITGPQKIPPFNRQGSGAGSALPGNNSSIGGMFKPPPSNGATPGPWDQQPAVMMDNNQSGIARWNSPGSSIDVMPQAGMMSRPLNKGSSQRWANGQHGGVDSGFMGGHPINANQSGGRNMGQWSNVGVNKFSGQGGPWPQGGNDFGAPMMLHPPPQHPGGGGPRMHQMIPPSGQYQSIFRQNVTRQLVGMGISIDEIQQSLQRNNMDLEKSLIELRDKFGHLGIDAMINPVSSYSNQQMYPFETGAPDVMGTGNDFNRMTGPHAFNDRNRQQLMMMMNSGQPSPTNEIAILSQRDNQINVNIINLQNKIQDLNRQYNTMAASANSAHCSEVQQQIFNVSKQLQSLKQQQTSIRSQKNMLMSGGGVVGRPISGAGGAVVNAGPVSNPGASIDMMNDTQYRMGELRLSQPTQNPAGLWSAPPSASIGKPHRVWLLLKDIPPSSANVDLLKYSLAAAFESSGPVNYEMHPNMGARWCLMGFSGQAEVQRVMQLFQMDRARFGTLEIITPHDAMNYLQEIQNLSRSNAFGLGQGQRWMQPGVVNPSSGKVNDVGQVLSNMGLLETLPGTSESGSQDQDYNHDDMRFGVEQLDDQNVANMNAPSSNDEA